MDQAHKMLCVIKWVGDVKFPENNTNCPIQGKNRLPITFELAFYT